MKIIKRQIFKTQSIRLWNIIVVNKKFAYCSTLQTAKPSPLTKYLEVPVKKITV